MGSSSEWESEGNRVVDSESIASDVESTSSCHCRDARNAQPLQGGEYKTRVGVNSVERTRRDPSVRSVRDLFVGLVQSHSVSRVCM